MKKPQPKMTTKCTSTQTPNSGVQKKKTKKPRKQWEKQAKTTDIVSQLTYIHTTCLHTYICMYMDKRAHEAKPKAKPKSAPTKHHNSTIHSDRRASASEAPHPKRATKNDNKQERNQKNTLKTRRKRSKRMAVDRHSFGDRTGNQHTHTHTCSMKSYKSSFAAVVAADEGLEGIAVAGPSNFVRKIKTNSQKMRETTINKSK